MKAKNKTITFKKLNFLLLERNIKKSDLAKMTGLTRAYISSILNDYFDPLTSATLKICNTLKCNLKDICELVEGESNL